MRGLRQTPLQTVATMLGGFRATAAADQTSHPPYSSRRSWRDRRVSTTILFALSMPMLIGCLGLGFEVSNWYRTQRVTQNVADVAVLAATFNGGANYDVEGKAVAAPLGFTDCVAVTVLQNVACPGGESTCYSTTNSVPLYLSPVVGYTGGGSGKTTLTAPAIAIPGTIQRPYCRLALASSGTTPATATSGAPAPTWLAAV
jgi:uncharacterized membrane protein